jgi:hypothetical protein
LAWVCDQAKATYSRDPRAGGFSFVGQPSVVDYVVRLLDNRSRELQRPVVIGSVDGEVVAWWTHGGARIPFRCSHRARDAKIWCLPDDKLVPAVLVDRHSAAELRMAIHKGEIKVVQ